MERAFSLFMFSTLLLVQWEHPLTWATSFQPTVEIVTGLSKVFTGETVRLQCIPPVTPYKATWSISWFRGSHQLAHGGEQLVLWNIKTKDSGKYYCESVRETSVRDSQIFQSVPVEISVDGGWAILDTPSQSVVGYPVNMTCRVRGKYPIHELVLYRNGVEILKQDDPRFILNNLTVEDWGEYTCRASWNRHSRTTSVISAQVSVKILEPMTKPSLIIDDSEKMRSLSKLKLICLLDYNVPEPAPPVLYYFYINGNRYGTPASNNYILIDRLRGTFKCHAKVSTLGLSQWSEPETY